MTNDQSAPERMEPSPVLSTEDPAQFGQLRDELRAVYLPLNSLAASVVHDIAVARWQILRLDGIVTRHWELALADRKSVV